MDLLKMRQLLTSNGMQRQPGRNFAADNEDC